MIGIAMGMGVAMPGIFLRTFAADLDIPRVGLYFFVFSVAGFTARILTRHWFERFGIRRMILAGMTGLIASQLLFLLVHAEWQLVVPAIGFGVAQALAFPAVVAAGSVRFPVEHRGLAMVMILAASDLGQLIGAPVAGEVLHYSKLAGLPPYPTMFITVVGLLAGAVIWYAVGRDGGDEPLSHSAEVSTPIRAYRKAI
jgi:MFS family permease